MGLSAVFIDGGYLDKVLHYNFKGQRIDYGKLVNEIVKAPQELFRAYYYHCLPYQSEPPSSEEKERYSRMHRFTTGLNHLPRFQVRLGRLAFRGLDVKGNKIFQQKRVDCMIGVDMALLAGKGKIERLTLFSGDSDLLPAIEAVKSEGIIVSLWHGAFNTDTAPSRELYETCDDRFELTGEIIKRICR